MLLPSSPVLSYDPHKCMETSSLAGLWDGEILPDLQTCDLRELVIQLTQKVAHMSSILQANVLTDPDWSEESVESYEREWSLGLSIASPEIAKESRLPESDEQGLATASLHTPDKSRHSESDEMSAASPRIAEKSVFSERDAVDVWSNTHRRWFLDGRVTKTDPDGTIDPKRVMGSILVTFDQGQQRKWIQPKLQKKVLRPGCSEEILKVSTASDDSEWCGSHTAMMHTEIREGWFQCWRTLEEASMGDKAQRGFKIKETRVERAGVRFKLISHGQVLKFEAASQEQAQRWQESFLQHRNKLRH